MADIVGSGKNVKAYGVNTSNPQPAMSSKLREQSSRGMEKGKIIGGKNDASYSKFTTLDENGLEVPQDV